MATITDLADAIVTELNATEFALAFEAVRAYAPRFDLEEMDTLRVSVVARAIEIITLTRSEFQHDYQVDVAVQQKFSAETNLALDPLMGLVEEIDRHFEGMRLASPDAICVRVANAPIYAPEHIKEKRMFTSVITLTWRMLS